MLAELTETQRPGQNVTVVDVRREQVFTLDALRSSSAALFFDLYNRLNSNGGQNLSWVSGAAYLRPLNIIPRRITRFGAKFQW